MTCSTTRPYLLVADDDADLRTLLASALREGTGCQVVECANGVQLLERLEGVLSGEVEPGLRAVIADIRMPGITGLSVLEGLHELGSAVPVFLITAFGTRDLHERVRQLGAVRLVDKPFDVDALVADVVGVVGAV